jgi:hypothetical protein
MFTYWLVGAMGVLGLYRASKWLRRDRTELPPRPQNIIYLVDQNIDHLFSIMDLIKPKADAFDQPFLLCQQIGQIPPETHIKIVICTHGGSLTNCEKILKKLKKHPGGYTAYIKNECFSAGTIIALGAQEIIMTDDSYLGKIDPQIVQNSIMGSYPAIVYSSLDEKYITGDNIKDVRISQQVLNYTDSLLELIFNDNQQLKKIVSNEMIYSNFPHSKTFDFETCKKMGLSVRNPTDDELTLFL